MKFTTLDDYIALNECANSIGDASIKDKKTILTESAESKKVMYESIGEVGLNIAQEPIRFIDAVAAKYNVRNK